MKKKPPNDTLDQVNDFVDASRQLNYKRIAAHDRGAVSRLNEAVKTLNLPRASVRKASKDPRLSLNSGKNSGFDIWKSRLKSLREILDQHGFQDRVDKLYSSSAESRLIGIDQVAHLRGLPSYDLLVAPDFAPVTGLHGIFIVGGTVRSMILPSECMEVGAWRLLRQKSFDTEQRMLEWVQAFASGQDHNNG